MSRAQQLPLTLSVADSARLRLDCELADAYGREQHDRVLELAEENDTLSEYAVHPLDLTGWPRPLHRPREPVPRSTPRERPA